MRFETKEDKLREQKAIQSFVNMFNGSYKKLGENDIDYKVFDSSDKLIAYAEIKGRLRSMSEAFPLPVAARKLVKLSDKRLNPVMVWACFDGIIYCKVLDLKGVLKWGGREKRIHSYNDEELMVYFEKKDCPFKFIEY